MTRLFILAGALIHAAGATECGRLLLNAAPAGLAATATITHLARGLRKSRVRFGLIGAEPTLRAQRGFKDQEVFELSPRLDDKDIRERLRGLRQTYSHFFSAADFRYANLAADAGFAVGVIDPRAWDRDPYPHEIDRLDLYVAQNFIGLARRLSADLDRSPRAFPNQTWIVDPVRPSFLGRRPGRSRQILISVDPSPQTSSDQEFGLALANALLSSSDLGLAALSPERLALVKPNALPPPPKRGTASKFERQLHRAGLAVLTPGLGVALAAAAARTPVVWLPPITLEQARLMATLEEHHLIDARVSWAEVLGDPAAAADPLAAARRFVASPDDQAALSHLLAEKSSALLAATDRPLRLPNLVRMFHLHGSGRLPEMIEVWLHQSDLVK